jgi:hypothetical protein
MINPLHSRSFGVGFYRSFAIAYGISTPILAVAGLNWLAAVAALGSVLACVFLRLELI